MSEKAIIVSRSERPIFHADREWEAGAILIAVGAFAEAGGDAVRLYYLVRYRDDPLKAVLCLARSTDLVNWEKPDLGDGTNIVFRNSGTVPGYGAFLPFRILQGDAGTAGEPAWSMIFWDRLSDDRQPGVHLAASDDGLHWQTLTERPFITGSNDAASMIRVRDTAPTPFGKAAYYLYQQTWRYNPALPQERDNLKGIHRRISLWRSDSLQGPWRGPITMLEPDGDDPSDLQFYWLAPFHVAGGYGGLLHCHHTGDQTMDVQLVCSRDGWSWTRCLNRRPLLAPGDRGRFDCGMIAAWSEPVQWRNRLLLFYSGRATVHDARPRYPNDPLPEPRGGIGMVELAPDVFTALPL